MRRLLIASGVLALVLTGVGAPAQASEPVPSDQAYSLSPAPVDPSPSHHKIKAPPPGKGDLYQLVHGGFKDGADTTAAASDAVDSTTKDVSPHTAAVLLSAGVIVAKVATAKALKQPAAAKSKTAKAAKPAKTATQKQPTPQKTVAPKQPKTTKVSKVAPPNMTPQQAQQYAFQNPPRVRPKIHH